MSVVYSVLSIVFPALVLLLHDNPPGAFIALLLQATVIGWIPASIWAWKVSHEGQRKKKSKIEEDNKE
jgi:uncharacterized membrane protein YqaE (UPF0057 family)